MVIFKISDFISSSSCFLCLTPPYIYISYRIYQAVPRNHRDLWCLFSPKQPHFNWVLIRLTHFTSLHAFFTEVRFNCKCKKLMFLEFNSGSWYVCLLSCLKIYIEIGLILMFKDWVIGLLAIHLKFYLLYCHL